MSVTCITPGCKKPVHKHGFRFCSDCAIETLQQQLKHAETRINGLPLRDYFAATVSDETMNYYRGRKDRYGNRQFSPAQGRFRAADDMLAARKEQSHD